MVTVEAAYALAALVAVVVLGVAAEGASTVGCPGFTPLSISLRSVGAFKEGMLPELLLLGGFRVGSALLCGVAGIEDAGGSPGPLPSLPPPHL